MRLKYLTIGLLTLTATISMAQSPQMEEKLMAIKQNMAKNKQQLAQYTYTQTETISLKGDVKDTRTYQVSDGQRAATEDRDQRPESSVWRRSRRPSEKARSREEDRRIQTVWSVNWRVGQAVHYA